MTSQEQTFERLVSEKDSQDHWTFFRSDGIAIPDCGYHARDMPDDDISYEDQLDRYENPPPRYFH